MSNPISPIKNDARQFVILRYESVAILFPRSEVASINLITELNHTDVNKSVGQIATDQQKWFIFGLSASLKISATLAKNARFCVCFSCHDNQRPYGLVCDEVESLQLSRDANIIPIPVSMDNIHSPIDDIYQHNNEVVFVTDTVKMRHYLEYCGITND